MTAKIPAANVKLKRAYEFPVATDGTRILIDRLWPRGISKEKAALDQWIKEIAPSAKLRKWFGHDPARWDEFRRRYATEVHDNAALLDQLRSLARRGPITLVYSAHDESTQRCGRAERFGPGAQDGLKRSLSTITVRICSEASTGEMSV